MSGKPMRVAFIVGHFPRLSETFILNQATGLIDRGHQVDIFSEYEGDWDHVHPDVMRYGLRQRTYRLQTVPKGYLERALKGLWLLLTRFPRAPRLMVRSLNIFRHGSEAAGLWLLYGAASLVDSGLPQQGTQYDIIHCQFGTQGHRGWFLQRVMQPVPKLIVMFRGHDISSTSYVRAEGTKTYAGLFKATDRCLTNCKFFRQRLIELGCPPEKASVHYSGLDVAKFAYSPRHLEPGGEIRLVTTGRLVEKKGIEYAIRAVAQQAQHHPRLRYCIIGGGPLQESLQALIRSLGAEAFIHLVGWKNEAEIIAILRQAHLFIAPSVTAADGNQDAPINVLKEAMAMGLPVLSTYHGGIPELVQDGVSGYLVPERDSEALAARLGDLLNHPERWESMGQAGRAYVEAHYNINTLNDRLVQVYEQLTRVPPGDHQPQQLQTFEHGASGHGAEAAPSTASAAAPFQILGE